MLTLQATERHPSKKAGERYEVDRNQALIDLASKHAVAPKPGPVIRTKRRYRRRDLQAE